MFWVGGSFAARGVTACPLRPLSLTVPPPVPPCQAQVDFNSRSEYDSINNYKALQAAFDRVGVDKVRGEEREEGGEGRPCLPPPPPPPLTPAHTNTHIQHQPVDVAKLIKARPLDNIEFMQWFKARVSVCVCFAFFFFSRTRARGENHHGRAHRAPCFVACFHLTAPLTRHLRFFSFLAPHTVLL